MWKLLVVPWEESVEDTVVPEVDHVASLFAFRHFSCEANYLQVLVLVVSLSCVSSFCCATPHASIIELT